MRLLLTDSSGEWSLPCLPLSESSVFVMNCSCLYLSSHNIIFSFILGTYNRSAESGMLPSSHLLRTRTDRIGSSKSEERERRKAKRWEKRSQRRQQKLDLIMRSDDHKQSSMREGSQKCAFEDGGDNCRSPRDDTSPSKLTPKDEIAAAPPTNIKLYTTTHNRLNNQPKHEL